MEIYLVRHGQTDYNLKRLYTGQTDVPMNETGREQIRSIAPMLAPIAWDRVICSPLVRAKETARILAPACEPEAFSWLMEMDVGTWAGHTWQEVETMDPEGAARYRQDWTVRLGGGECFDDVCRRVAAGIRQIVRESDPAAKILVASHAAPMVQTALTLLDLPAHSYWHWIPAQGAYSHLTAYPERELWFSLAEWNARPRLGTEQ